MQKRGFTVSELMVVIGIIVILGGIGVTNFGGFKRAQDLKSTATSLANYIRDTQQKSITQEIGPALGVSAKWGVRIEAQSGGDDSYTIFYCNVCTTINSVNRIVLPNSVEFTVPAQGGAALDIIFSKLYGAPEGGNQTITITQIGGGDSKTINISNNGLIEVVDS
ncbi:MAG TPA: prepilin-type N-terminal cleavage/methylation domain-containing protein [Candidatus Paceibacterota bacterium]